MDELEELVRTIDAGLMHPALPTPPPTPPPSASPASTTAKPAVVQKPPSIRVSIPFGHTMPEKGRLRQRSDAVTQAKWAALMTPPPPPPKRRAPSAGRSIPAKKSRCATTTRAAPSAATESSPTTTANTEFWPPQHQLPSAEQLLAALNTGDTKAAPAAAAPPRKAPHDTPMESVAYEPGEWAQIPRRAIYQARRYKLRLPHRRILLCFDRDGRITSRRDLPVSNTAATG